MIFCWYVSIGLNSRVNWRKKQWVYAFSSVAEGLRKQGLDWMRVCTRDKGMLARKYSWDIFIRKYLWLHPCLLLIYFHWYMLGSAYFQFWKSSFYISVVMPARNSVVGIKSPWGTILCLVRGVLIQACLSVNSYFMISVTPILWYVSELTYNKVW